MSFFEIPRFVSNSGEDTSMHAESEDNNTFRRRSSSVGSSLQGRSLPPESGLENSDQDDEPPIWRPRSTDPRRHRHNELFDDNEDVDVVLKKPQVSASVFLVPCSH